VYAPTIATNGGVIQSAVTDLADRLGESASRITVRDANWVQYMQEGVTVSLTIGRNRMKANLSLDQIGLQGGTEADRKAFDRILDPGARYLLPRETMKAFENLESKARYALEKRSLKTHWGKFVHESKYAEWREANAEIEIEYRALAQRVADEWESLRDRVRLDYIVLALDVYRSLLAREASTGQLLLAPEDRGQDAFVRRFLERAFSTSITPEAFLSSINYYWSVTYLPTAKQIAEDQVAAGQVRLSRAQELILEDVRATAQREAAEGVERFIADVKAQVNDQVYQCVVNALEGIEKNDGRSPRNTSASLRLMIEEVRGLVFWDDPELDARIAAVDRVISIDAKRRSDAELKASLVALGSQARLVLTELDRTPTRSASKVGIADDLGDLEVGARRGQANLSLEDLGDIEQPTRRRRGNRDIVL
jgi:hypothetical protein